MKEQTRKIFEEYLQSHLGAETVDPEPFLEKVSPEDRAAFQRKVVALRELNQTFLKISGDLSTLHSPLHVSLEEKLTKQSYAGCRVERKLGQGGMGVVYLASQEKLKREVVLKILRPFAIDNPTLVSRFLRESEIIAGLDHPNIVPIYDVGEEQDSLFIIMKFIQGRSLAQLIDHLNTLDRNQITLKDISLWLAEGVSPQDKRHQLPGHDPLQFYLSVMQKVAEAVQFAHHRGVAHRDIKPSNIIIQPDGSPILLDFGLAWVEKEQDMTVEGEFLGTPVYSAPESFGKHGSQNFFLWDVYSLGVTTYELVTGKLPYEGETLYEVYNHLKSKEPIRPKVFWKDIPGDLETILMTAIAKDPKLRYPSVDAFREDLDRFLHGQPILAEPPPWWQRMFYFLKRNYRWEIPSALALVAIVGIFMATRSSIRLSEVEAEKIVLENISHLLDAKREKAHRLFQTGKMVLEETEKNLSDLTRPPAKEDQALAKEISELEDSLRRSPEDPNIREALATEYLAQGNLPEAEGMGKEILKLDPQSYIGHLILADVYLVQGQDLEKAQALVRDFNQYFPEESLLNGLLGTRCLLLGNFECAREFLRLAAWQNPRKFGEFLIATQMSLGNFEEARRLYEVGTEYFPDHPEYLEGLALVLAKLERFQEAHGVAEQAHSVDPANPRIEKLLQSIDAQIFLDKQKQQGTSVENPS